MKEYDKSHNAQDANALLLSYDSFLPQHHQCRTLTQYNTKELAQEVEVTITFHHDKTSSISNLNNKRNSKTLTNTGTIRQISKWEASFRFASYVAL